MEESNTNFDQTSNKKNYIKFEKNNKYKLLLIVSLLVIIGLIIMLFVTMQHKVKQHAKVLLSPAIVTITSKGYIPQTIQIKLGQGVVWTNSDNSRHLVNSDPFPKDNKLSNFNLRNPLLFNQQYSFVFNKTGTFTYHDDLNPFKFQGTVIVTK